MKLITPWVCLLLAQVALGGELSPVKGPLAVMALVTDQEQERAVEMAGAIHRKLADRVDVLPVGELRFRLGGIGPLDGDLERLRGLYNQGYMQSYRFEYRKAVANLSRALEGLEHVPPGPARWDLFVQANVYLGKSHIGLKDRDRAKQAFRAVLRTRSDMELNRKEHPPSNIKLWNETRKDLAGLPRGRLEVDSVPKGAEVLLDGVKVGETPFSGWFSHGRYHLRVRHPKTGAFDRWVEIGRTPTRLKLPLPFECTLVMDGEHPAVRLPDEKAPFLWSWLGARLGVQRLAMVQIAEVGKQHRWIVSLVDLERRRVIREGWLNPSGPEPKHQAVDAIDLADFLAGGSTRRVVQKVPPTEPPGAERKETQEATKASKSPTADEPAPAVHVSATAERPLGRTWWPYAVGGAVALGGGVAASVASDQYGTSSGYVGKDDAADTWLGVAIAGYVLAGALTLTGLILHLTYEPDEPPRQALVPSFGPDGVSLQWVGRF